MHDMSYQLYTLQCEKNHIIDPTNPGIADWI